MQKTTLCLSAVLLVGCASSQSLRESPEEATAFRRTLADPGKFPLRQGMKVDTDRLLSAVNNFARANEETLQAWFEGSLANLPPGELPAEPEYTKVSEGTEDSIKAAREQSRLYWPFYPKIESTLMWAIGPVIAMPVSELDDSSHEDIAGWLAFFFSARPSFQIKDRKEDKVTLLANYGDVDIFVVTLIRDGIPWVPESVAWWKRTEEMRTTKKENS